MRKGILCAFFTLLTFLSSVSAGDASINYGLCQAAVQSGAYGLTGAVDSNGIPITSVNQTIEGLLYPQCLSFCGDGWERNTFANASAAVTTWLFPWLVLVAQLPFQTRGDGYDMLSGLLIIGSPLLAMYSLLATLSNSMWIYAKCKETHIQTRYKDPKHMARVAFILSACQQVPLFIEDTTLFACSVVLSRNRQWWQDIAARLRDSTRTFVESLWPQILIVLVTYILTLVYVFEFEAAGNFDFHKSLISIDNYTGLGMSIGMAWSWTFPLVIGWFSVGTQMRRNSVSDTLNWAKKRLEIPYWIARTKNIHIHGEYQETSIKRTNTWPIAQPKAPLAQFEGTPEGQVDRLWGFRIAGDQENLSTIMLEYIPGSGLPLALSTPIFNQDLGTMRLLSM